MSLKSRSSAALLSLSLGFGLVADAHAARPGWYVIGSGGESSIVGSPQGQMDENLVAIFDSVGLAVLDFSSEIDDSDTGFSLAGGYQLNDHFAVEFGYVDLGSLDYRATAEVSDGVEQAEADVAFESTADGAVVSGLAILPIGTRFSLFGRVGLSFMSAEGTARIAIQGVSDRASQSSQKIDPVFGAGAELSLGRYFAIRLAWDRYLDVGTEDVSGDIDADVVTLGLRMGLDWFR
jgi:OOP family OmpA-OmpF porin